MVKITANQYRCHVMQLHLRKLNTYFTLVFTKTAPPNTLMDVVVPYLIAPPLPPRG